MLNINKFFDAGNRDSRKATSGTQIYLSGRAFLQFRDAKRELERLAGEHVSDAVVVLIATKHFLSDPDAAFASVMGDSNSDSA